LQVRDAKTFVHPQKGAGLRKAARLREWFGHTKIMIRSRAIKDPISKSRAWQKLFEVSNPVSD